MWLCDSVFCKWGNEWMILLGNKPRGRRAGISFHFSTSDIFFQVCFYWMNEGWLEESSCSSKSFLCPCRARSLWKGLNPNSGARDSRGLGDFPPEHFSRHRVWARRLEWSPRCSCFSNCRKKDFRYGQKLPGPTNHQLKQLLLVSQQPDFGRCRILQSPDKLEDF